MVVGWLKSRSSAPWDGGSVKTPLSFFQGAHPHTRTNTRTHTPLNLSGVQHIDRTDMSVFGCIEEMNNGRMIWRQSLYSKHGYPLTEGTAFMDWSSSSPEQIWGETERWGGIWWAVCGGHRSGSLAGAHCGALSHLNATLSSYTRCFGLIKAHLCNVFVLSSSRLLQPTKALFSTQDVAVSRSVAICMPYVSVQLLRPRAIMFFHCHAWNNFNTKQVYRPTRMFRWNISVGRRL